LYYKVFTCVLNQVGQFSCLAAQTHGEDEGHWGVTWVGGDYKAPVSRCNVCGG
jgi:hypothetical protein